MIPAQPAPYQLQHDPFVVRKVLVVLACMVAGGVGFFAEDVWIGWAVYGGVVTLLDLVTHHVLNIPLLRHVDPAKLLLTEGVTPAEFEAYYATRRWIRCASLAAALVGGGLMGLLLPGVGLQVFCGAYVVTTWIGIFYVRHLNIPRPRMLRNEGRCAVLPEHIPLPIYGTEANYYAARAAGWAPWKKTYFPDY